jgi:hypothetical protein
MTTSTRADRAGSVEVAGSGSEAGTTPHRLAGPIEDGPHRRARRAHHPRYVLDREPGPLLEEESTAIVGWESGQHLEEIHTGLDTPGQVAGGNPTIGVTGNERVEIGVDDAGASPIETTGFGRSGAVQPKTESPHPARRGGTLHDLRHQVRLSACSHLGCPEQILGQTLQLEAVLPEMFVDRLESGESMIE